LNNSIENKLVATHFIAQRSQTPVQSDIPKELTLNTIDDVLAVQKLMIYLNNQKVYGWKCMIPSAEGEITLAPLLHKPIESNERCALYTENDKALIEPEIAFVLDTDLHSNKQYSNEEIDTAFGRAYIALELIQNRFSKNYQATRFEKLADGLSNQGIYLGPQIAKDKAYESSRINVNIKQPSQVLNLAGKHPAGLAQLPLYWAINFLSEQGFSLTAGQVFITGSYCGLVKLNTNEKTSISYENLGTFDTTFLKNKN